MDQQNDSITLRQQDHSGCYKSQGLQQIPQVTQPGQPTLPGSPQEQLPTASVPLTGHKEHTSRQPEQTSSDSNRVDTRPKVIRPTSEQVWSVRSESVCKSPQCSAENLHLTISPCKSRWNKCPNDRLEQMEINLPIPTNSSHSKTVTSHKRIQGKSMSNSTPVASPAVVSRPHKSAPKAVPNSRSKTHPGNSHRHHHSPKSWVLHPKHMDTLTQVYRNKASILTAQLIAERQAPSTLKQYQSAYDRLRVYVQDKQYHKMSKSRLLNFFLYLYNSGLQYKALLVHRSALRDVCRLLWSVDLCDHEFSALLSRFQRDRPTRKPPAPRWDLDMVLTYLRTGDFSRGQEISVNQALMKAIFLCTLACGQRVGELTALRRDELHLEMSERLITFHPHEDFKFKSDRLMTGPLMWTIPAYIDKHNRHHSLCPVQAIRAYIEKTANWNNPHGHLWLHPRSGKPLNANRVAFYAKSLIKLSQPLENGPVRFHDIRKKATSAAFFGGLSLEQLCQRACWNSSHVFFKNYLHPLKRKIPKCIAMGIRVGPRNQA